VSEVSRTPDAAGAQRRADVQLAVGRVLGEAKTVDEAVPSLLAALADALNWTVNPELLRLAEPLDRHTVSFYSGARRRRSSKKTRRATRRSVNAARRLVLS